jgi:2-aminobenzoylacetyl-CoA thioesterase
MRIRKPGRINDHLWFLGRTESCIYLLEGARESMVINGGLSFQVPEILHQFQDFSINVSKIKKILLLHSHFDHVGIVPYLKRRNPEIIILASGPTWHALKKPKVLKIINARNHEILKKRGLVEACELYDLDWRDDITGDTVSEGDRIDLGDMEVIILETPGHSSCSIAAHVPEHQILFPSEAAGLPCGEKIITYGTYNYTDFENSIQKLKDLPAKYICSDHYGYITGDEATSFIKNSIQAAKERRLLMQSLYKRTQNVDEAAKELVRLFRDENMDNIVPEDVFLGSHRQMILHVLGKQR